MIATGSIKTEVELEFRHDDERDRTTLYRRQAGGLCHIGKPYWDGGVLGLQVVNPTAGIFSGDDLTVSVDVGENARVALSSPSATRFHTMEQGGANILQKFDVGPSAWFDYQPEWTIPQRRSEVDQITRINLAPGATMAFQDLVAPGRVAHGESCEYRRYTTTFELNRGGTTVASERMDLLPDQGGWPLAVPGWDTCYYAAVWFVSDLPCIHLTSDLESDLASSELYCGTSEIAENVTVIRLLSSKSPPLRHALREIRTTMTDSLPHLTHNFRKL